MLSAAQREAVLALAQKAAAGILAVYDSASFADDAAIEQKEDRSPLTAADLASHRCIVAGLQALTPDVPVLSEESSQLDIAGRRAWKTFWLVDPLDGTREFIKRNGEFTVNIALVDDGVATFGVIQQPVTGSLWHGAPGHGAFRRASGQDGRDADSAIHVRSPAHAPLRIAASRSHRDGRTQALLDALPGSEVVGCGSSLKFCRIAEGGIDLIERRLALGPHLGIVGVVAGGIDHGLGPALQVLLGDVVQPGDGAQVLRGEGGGEVPHQVRPGALLPKLPQVAVGVAIHPEEVAGHGPPWCCAHV